MGRRPDAVPAEVPAVVVDRNQTDDGASALGAALAQHPSLVSYLGHGSQDLWSGGLLSSASVAALAGQGPPAFWAG